MAVTVADVLELRATPLSQCEVWSLLCQATQALQDLFLLNGVSLGSCLPVVTPNTLQVTSKGRVILELTPARHSIGTSLNEFLAPEFTWGQTINLDADLEKMWIFSLGRTLQRCSGPDYFADRLHVTLDTMTLAAPGSRASLMDLLDGISELCKLPSLSRPFSQIVMGLYSEVLGEPSQFLPPRSKAAQTMEHHQRSNSLPKHQTSLGKENNTNINKSCSMSSKEEQPARRHPVQRAASRLYRTRASLQESQAKYCSPNTCIGPEFVIRAANPSKVLHMVGVKPSHKKRVVVILLNGQKLDIFCDPNTTTGQIFEVVIHCEILEENFMFGLAMLFGGDFVFVPSDIKLCKIAPSGWTNDSKKHHSVFNFTLYLRVKFFLPSLRGLKSWTTKHLLYLQLRRMLLEQQMCCDMNQHVTLSGLALQAEFGDYVNQEHGRCEYFILDHYIPESLIQFLDESQLSLNLQKAHKGRQGMDPGRAEEMYIAQVQKLATYGSHFFHSICTTKSCPSSEVWLAVSGEGVALYNRSSDLSGKSLLQLFEWKNIQTLSHNKHYFFLLPKIDNNGTDKPNKYKLKMEYKKSFYVFHLAYLHHQFFLKLRIELSSLQSLSSEFGVPMKHHELKKNPLFDIGENKAEHHLYCSASLYTQARNIKKKKNSEIQDKLVKTYSKSTAMQKNIFKEKNVNDVISGLNKNQDAFNIEEYQNKENENPLMNTKDKCSKVSINGSRKNGTSENGKGVANVSTGSLTPKRQHVKMGTRSILGGGASHCSVSESSLQQQESLRRSVQAVSSCSSPNSSPQQEHLMFFTSSEAQQSSLPGAYVLNSSIKSIDEQFELDFHETLSESLREKFDNISFADERVLSTVRLLKDECGSLGIQITAGCDGGVYIQWVIPGGPADKLGSVHKGDQLIAVDGHTLLNLKYEEALELLQSTGEALDLVLSQVYVGDEATSKENPFTSVPASHNTRYIHKSSGTDLMNEVLQKPIEDSYLKNIRYDTTPESDCTGTNMISNTLPNSTKIPSPNFWNNLEEIEIPKLRRELDIKSVPNASMAINYFSPFPVGEQESFLYWRAGVIPGEESFL